MPATHIHTTSLKKGKITKKTPRTMPSPLPPQTTHTNPSIHRNNRPKPLHRLHDLLALLLGHRVLQHLGRALDELLAIHQAEAQHALDLLDDLGLGARVERLEREGEERLLLRRGGGFGFFFLDGGGAGRGGAGGGGGGGGEAHGHVGDVEAGLGGGALVGGFVNCIGAGGGRMDGSFREGGKNRSSADLFFSPRG